MKFLYKGKTGPKGFEGKVIIFNEANNNLLIAIWSNNKIRNNYVRKICEDGTLYEGTVKQI